MVSKSPRGIRSLFRSIYVKGIPIFKGFLLSERRSLLFYGIIQVYPSFSRTKKWLWPESVTVLCSIIELGNLVFWRNGEERRKGERNAINYAKKAVEIIPKGEGRGTRETGREWWSSERECFTDERTSSALGTLSAWAVWNRKYTEIVVFSPSHTFWGK